MKKIALRHAALAAAISTLSSGATAAGFYLQETSTSGLGRAFAAENTIGDNAAILARNPAGSALFDTITISGGVTYIDPEIDARGDVTYFVDAGGGVLVPVGPFDAHARDYASSAFVPNAYLAVPFNESWSFGLALFTDYGLETKFKRSFPAANIAQKTELLTVNVAPSVAYNYQDIFAIGVSVNFLYADATLKTNVPENFALDPFLPSPPAPLSGQRVMRLTGDDWDVGWSIGALWNIDERTRVGFSYHSEFDPKLEGRVSSDFLPDFNTGGTLNRVKGHLTLDLPDTYELGFYHRFRNDQWGIALGVMYTDWDDFERLEAFVPGQPVNPFIDYHPLHLKEENFRSGWRYSIGVEYYPCEEVTWRVGYAYDQGAARNGLNREESLEVGLPITWRTLSIPDTDRQWVSFGGTYQFDKHLSVDGAVTYIWGDDEKIQEFTALPVPTYFDGGTTNTEAWLGAVSLNYRF